MASPAPRGAAPAELVGRARELEIVEELLDDLVVDGRPVLFLGEAGIGKSALLEHAAREARARGYTVLRADGVEFESDIGYSSLNQGLLPIRRYIDGLDPAHVHALGVVLGMRSGDQPDRLVVSTATLHLLQAAAARAPVLFLGDDLQWADPRSQEVFFFLTRRLSGTRIGMLGTARPGYGGAMTLGRVEHHLGPLEPADADRLLRQRFPTLAPRIRGRLLSEARGNPLALLELPPALSPPIQAGRMSAPPTLPLSSRLQSVFAARISSLPADVQDLLLLAALDGTGDLGVLRAAGGGDEIGGLDDAERSGLVQVNLADRRLVFRHPLTRSAVVESATESRRRQAHTRLAAAWAHDLDKQAWHLGEAALGSDESLAALLEARGRRALARGDFGGLPSLLRSAELSPDPAQRSRRIAEAAFVAAHKSGAPAHLARSIADLREAEPGTETALFLAATTAWLIVDSGEDLENGFRILTAAIEAIRPEVDRSGPAMRTSLRVLSLVCVYAARPDLAQQVLELLRKVGVADAVRDRLTSVLDPAGTPPEVLAAIDQDLADLRSTDDPVEVVRLGSQVDFLDRLSRCRPTLERLLVVESGGVQLTEEVDVRRLLAEEAWFSGRWERGLALCEEIEAMADTFHLRRPKVGVYVVRGLISAATGSWGAMRQCADQLRAWTLGGGGRLTQLIGHLILAQHAAAIGDFEEAFARASTLMGDGGGPSSFMPIALWALLDFAEAATRSGRIDVARRFAATLRQRGLGRLSPRYAMITDAAGALVASDGAEAAAAFARALGRPGADAWVFDHSRVALLATERLAVDGASDLAASWAGVASEGFTALSARPWLERLGKAHETIAGIPSQPTAPAGLTPTEYKIVSLAAEGLTNKEIGRRLYLSPRTVSTYLYKAFPKLDVTTRAGLRDALGRAELPRRGSSAGEPRPTGHRAAD
ncbi:hypothetical protein BL253_28175 [Pseudofrankia asymbiotica]|uniref:HTH luxR-type domain-containing protein n=1 Tax=Pseudofrankia asymbiotica TaxID=1834516 RepID=A0A1V2I635_9ACTN|nr:hypothetical protein BL253_28175 [Pseudofrankia asymbiotica]